MWDLFEAKHLFNLVPNGEDVNAYHLARMVALLGHPPPDLLRRSATDLPWQYFDKTGQITLSFFAFPTILIYSDR